MELINYIKFNTDSKIEIHQIVETDVITDTIVTINTDTDREKAFWHFVDETETQTRELPADTIEQTLKDIRFAASQHDAMLFDDDNTPVGDLIYDFLIFVKL